MFNWNLNYFHCICLILHVKCPNNVNMNYITITRSPCQIYYYIFTTLHQQQISIVFRKVLNIILGWRGGGEFENKMDSGTNTHRGLPKTNNSGFLFLTLFLGSMLPQYMALCVCMLRYVKNNVQATSKLGRRLRFGLLTVLINIRSTKML